MASEKFATLAEFRAHCLEHAADIFVRAIRGPLAGSYALSELPEAERDEWISKWWKERQQQQPPPTVSAV